MPSLGELYKTFIVSSIKNTNSVPDVDEWTRFLASLAEPKDCFDRSWNKYLCRRHFVSFEKSLMLNVLAVPPLILCLLSTLYPKRTRDALKDGGMLVVHSKEVPLDDIFPQELEKSHAKRVDVPYNEKKSRLTKDASVLFLKSWLRHPLHPYYQLFVWKELSKHCGYLTRYNPDAVVVYVNERNVASPILREMYEGQGRELISFMHGEYLLNLIQAYMDFSKYYVWDQCYIDMFSERLRCRREQFEVYTPLRLVKKWQLEETVPTHFCTYYCSGESEDSINRLAAIFGVLNKNGLKCLVRPHPRYSHVDLIEQVFDADQIEDPHSVSIKESLTRARYVVGLSSTVLSEALVEGKEVVIDDVTNPPAYENLRKRGYRVLEHNVLKLSQLLDEYRS